jgi:hypothetical protein
LLAHRSLERATKAAATAASDAAAEAAAGPVTQQAAIPAVRSESGTIITARTANDLNEQFFAANGEERRFILLGLPLIAPIAPGQAAVSRDPKLGKRIEAAALAHKPEELASQLAQALRIARAQARRIASDQLGEPITIALKAFAIPRDLVYRILMFVNPMVGHSVERVHSLALLFDEMTVPAAEGMVAIWQALPGAERAATKHHPLFWNDERSRARGATFARRRELPAQTVKRRDAS